MDSDVPVGVSGLTHIKAVAAGGDFSLALLSNGTVWAWGANESGQLGDGTTTDSVVPVQVSGLTGVKAISSAGSAGFASLALLNDGTVWAWGYNGYGQLGDGNNVNSDIPVQVTGLTGVVAIAVGGAHDLALLSNGTVMSWGRNGDGELGYGTFTNPTNVPAEVSSLTGVKAIAAGLYHNLAVVGNGTVVSWGDNNSGQLGNNNAPNDSASPVPVTGLTKVKSVAAGAYDSYAVLKNGTGMSWGENAYGELGNGDSSGTGSPVPVAISGLTNIKVISAGAFHVLALLKTKTLAAWGIDSDGELGTGVVGPSSATPLAISGLTGVKSVSAGYLFSLAST